MNIEFISDFYDHKTIGMTGRGRLAIVAKADYRHKGIKKTGYFGMTQRLEKPTPFDESRRSIRPHTGSRQTEADILFLLRTHY